MEHLLHVSVPKNGMHAELMRKHDPALSPSDPHLSIAQCRKNLSLASTDDTKSTHVAQEL